MALYPLSRLSFLFAGLFCLLSCTVFAKDIYVSPGGNDQSPGTKEQPLATLEGARNAVRTLLAEKSFREEIRVTFMKGTYYLTQALELNSMGSGHEGSPVVYRGEPGKEVEFIGGRRIANFEQVNEKLWKADVAADWHFEQLFVNGQRAVRARTPDQGQFFDVQKVEETVLKQGNGRAPESAIQRISVNPEDLKQVKQEADFEKVLMTFYHKWDNTRKYVQKYDAGEGVFYIRGEGLKPWNPINHESRFYFDNIKSGLDAPGEWYLEENGTLYYIPKEGEVIEESVIYAPVVEQFIIIKGKGRGQAMVENIIFENLRFKIAGYVTPEAGNEPAQAAAPIASVVMVDFAKNIHFKNCEIAHTGLGGIWFRETSSNNKVENSYLHDLGAGGIKLGTLNDWA